MTKTPFLSLYENKEAKQNKDISIHDYITFVRTGTNSSLVIDARLAKQNKDEELYKRLKNKSQAVTGSCTFTSGEKKTTQNISSLNGLIIIDIDNDQVTGELKTRLQNDDYTYIMHTSFGGGQNYCIFVKIDSNRFDDSFENLAQYYFSTYGIKIDLACKNKNRLRFLSFDPDIFVNDYAKRWKATKPKNIEVKKELTNYIFFENDFDNLLKQIKERGINLCSTYNRWVNVGMALASHFGISGADKFDFICSFDTKYDAKTNQRHYKGFCNSVEDVTIGTFYYYCKEVGLDIYSEKTKTIINAVKVSKSTGNPTIASVTKNVLTQGFEVEESDQKVIQQLIESKVDYSRLANDELKEIEVLENFILQRFDPKYNEINQNLYINDTTLVNDAVMASVVLTCMKHLDLKKAMTKQNVELIMGSAEIPTYNPILDFFREHYSEDCEKGLIEKYAKTIQPQNEYNVWAFKKWIVGAVHNWTCDADDLDICPHTLVLTGEKHGIGKTSFMRNILPTELRKYLKEDRIDINKKDSLFRMGTSLMIIDDEFGGKSIKETKDFKNVTAKDEITLRRPFQKFDITVRRRAILGGTTNETDIINDFDNRRIIPINFQGVNYEEMVSLDKVALLCEAYYELLHGYDWKIIGEEKEYLAENTKQNVAIMPFEEIFLGDFSLVEKNGTRPIIINQGDILKFYSDTIRANKYDVKDVIRKNKMENKSRSVNGKQKQGYLVYIDTNNKLFSTWYNGFTNDDDTPF